MPAFTEVGAISETSPVGTTVPDVCATVTAAATEVPCVIMTVDVAPLSFKLVVEALNAPTAVVHAVARLATSTEPRPVARSYPGAVVHAGAVGLARRAITPLAFAG